MVPIFLRLAYRNLRRNFRRTTLTVLSVAFGLFMVIWTHAILGGRNQNMIDTVISTKTGNVQIQKQEYWREHQVGQSMSDQAVELNSLLPEHSIFARRIFLPSIISTGSHSSSVLLTGVEPNSEAKVTNVLTHTIEGEPLIEDADPSCPSRQILVGKSLASILKISAGSRLVLMTEAADQSLGNDLFFVKGIFDSGSPDIDKSVAYTPLNCAKKLGALSGFHEIAIRLSDDALSIPTAQTLSQKFSSEFKVTTWKEALPMIASILHINNATVLMLSLILTLVISMGMINVILVSIIERIREFGVMLALGVTPFQLIETIFWEGFLMGLTGGVFGVVLAGIALLYNKYNGFNLKYFFGDQAPLGEFKMNMIIYPVFSLRFTVTAFFCTWVGVSLVSLIPTSRISKLEPMEALRS